MATLMPMVVDMETKVNIVGVVDRNDPDPSSPNDARSRWVGMVTITWDEVTAKAAIIRIETGGGRALHEWGATVPVVRWIGDDPPAVIARLAYDAVLDHAFVVGTFSRACGMTSTTVEHPTHRLKSSALAL